MLQKHVINDSRSVGGDVDGAQKNYVLNKYLTLCDTCFVSLGKYILKRKSSVQADCNFSQY